MTFWEWLVGLFKGTSKEAEVVPMPKPLPDPVIPMPPPKTAPGVLIGIDVSHHNGFIDWTKSVRGIKPQFAFCKATQGTSFVSSQFKNNWKNAPAAGIPMGAYHFFEPTMDGVAQANHFLRTTGLNWEGRLPPVLDWEPLPNKTGFEVSPALQKVRARDFLRTVEHATGRLPMIYGANYFLGKLGLEEEWARYPLWIANYNVTKPKFPLPWKDWVVWQKAENPIDINEFRGDAADLKRVLIEDNKGSLA